jgi:exonuclease VII large subunit
MHEEPALGFDLAAASVRADSAELAGALEAFAKKLEGALPGACRVKRRRESLLSRRTRVETIALDLGESQFSLQVRGHQLTAERTDHVHDMRKRTERLSLHDWLAALESELRRRATSGAEARAALDRLLED